MAYHLIQKLFTTMMQQMMLIDLSANGFAHTHTHTHTVRNILGQPYKEMRTNDGNGPQLSDRLQKGFAVGRVVRKGLLVVLQAFQTGGTDLCARKQES